MRQEFQNDEVIVRYLLNDLGDQEREQVEEKYFNDPDFLDQIDAVEAELIDKYALGLLSANEREKFERHVLNSHSQRQKAEFGKELIDLIEQEQLAISPAAPEMQSNKTSWWHSLLSVVSLPKPGLGFATATIVIVLGGGWLIVETVRLRSQFDQMRAAQVALEQQKEELRRRLDQEQKDNAETASELKRVQDELDRLRNNQSVFASAAFSIPTPLLSSNLRNVGGKAQKVEFPADAKAIELKLQLRPDIENYTAYSAVLVNKGGGEKTPIGKARMVKGGRIVTVVVSTNLLTNHREYSLVLEGKSDSGDDEEAGNYPFIVVKK